MKKILYTLFSFCLGIVCLSSCKSEFKEGPTLLEAETFILDDVEDKLYDLIAKDTVKLSITQPEYGFTAATTYTVEVSLNEDFEENSFKTLSTTYNNTTIKLLPEELNNSAAELYTALNPDADPKEQVITLYLRVKAEITGSGKGLSTSNTIKINQIKLDEVIVTLEPPTNIYLVGLQGDWETWAPMVKINGNAGHFWKISYFGEGNEFKFGTREQEYIAYNDPRVTAASGISISGGYGNFTIDTPGWYLVYIKAVVNGNDYKFDINIYKPNIYIFGATNGGTWDYSDSWKFENPTDANGEFVSPALSAAGEVRMTTKIDGYQWWQLEFTLKDGNIFYRENNAVNNGWGDIGSEYVISASPNQKIKLNFIDNTGSIE